MHCRKLPIGFVPALGFVIIGHYSVNGELSMKEYFNTAQRSNEILLTVCQQFESLIYTCTLISNSASSCHNRKLVACIEYM